MCYGYEIKEWTPIIKKMNIKLKITLYIIIIPALASLPRFPLCSTFSFLSLPHGVGTTGDHGGLEGFTREFQID